MVLVTWSETSVFTVYDFACVVCVVISRRRSEANEDLWRDPLS
jgi:hypothetical protein